VRCDSGGDPYAPQRRLAPGVLECVRVVRRRIEPLPFAYDNEHPLAQIRGRDAIGSVLDFALRDLDERGAMSEREEKPLVHHPYIVVPAHRPAVTPLFDAKAVWRLGAEFSVDPCAQGGKHKSVHADRTWRDRKAEVGSKVNDLASVV